MSIAFVFPGQGSQSIGMLQNLADENSAYAEIIHSTYAIASEKLGFDLWELVSNGPVEDLNKTENTQPALLAASVALYKIWQHENGEVPTIMAGHSLGEYSALVCAGVLDFAEAISLVNKRGLFMQEAVKPGEGAMAAILGLEDNIIEGVCEQLCVAKKSVVSAVNFNSPGQVVIAGYADLVDLAIDNLNDAGAKKCIKLPVSVPSHCELMAPAATKLSSEINQLKLSLPTIPVVNNVDVQIEKEADKISTALVNQLTKPVRWVETVQKIKSQGVTHFIECGPGKVLTGLSKRIDRSINGLAINDIASLNKALESVKE